MLEGWLGQRMHHALVQTCSRQDLHPGLAPHLARGSSAHTAFALTEQQQFGGTVSLRTLKI